METKDIIVEVIQSSLKGKIKENVPFNPQFLADDLIQKVEFNKPYGQKIYNKELIDTIKFFIESLKSDMKAEIENTKEDEFLLKNLIRGEIVACEKFNAFMNNLNS
jgi:hypothetical protein